MTRWGHCGPSRPATTVPDAGWGGASGIREAGSERLGYGGWAIATVLFADDDPDIRELGRLLLAKHGHEVVTAANGLEAIAMLPSVRPSLVITDVNMPQQDGAAVCTAVRSSPALREIPVILLTALPLDDERVVKASNVGNAMVLIKTDISRLGEVADSLVPRSPTAAA
ncbi:MAG: response regulator [Candidatus Dormibacteria bacterium]